MAFFGKYADMADVFGEEYAAKVCAADIRSANNRDKERRFKEKILSLPDKAVGCALKRVIANELGAENVSTHTRDALRAENYITSILLLDLEG